MMGKFNFRGVLVIGVVFFVFYGIYLYVTLQNKPQSAYSVLKSESKQPKLQDTRVHNWDEIETRDKRHEELNPMGR